MEQSEINKLVKQLCKMKANYERNLTIIEYHKTMNDQERINHRENDPDLKAYNIAIDYFKNILLTKT